MVAAFAAAVVVAVVAVLSWRGRRPPDPYYDLGVCVDHRRSRHDDNRLE